MRWQCRRGPSVWLWERAHVNKWFMSSSSCYSDRLPLLPLRLPPLSLNDASNMVGTQDGTVYFDSELQFAFCHCLWFLLIMFFLESTMTEASRSLWNRARILSSLWAAEGTCASDTGSDGKSLMIAYISQPDLPRHNDHPHAYYRTLAAR